MEKFKRYLGLAAAIALLVVALLPHGLGYDGPRRGPLLDHTTLSQLTTHQSHDWRFWTMLIGRLNYFCGKSQGRPADEIPTFRSCSSEAITVADVLRNRVDHFALREPALPALLDEYDKLLDAEAEARKAQNSDAGNGAPPRTPRAVELGLYLGGLLDTYLDEVQFELSIRTYTVHTALVLLVTLMVLFRQQVGGLLVAPFTMLFGAIGASAKAAKRIHDRV